jgi:3-phenylpropionate/cinnamic acid dioxygenase small subunit
MVSLEVHHQVEQLLFREALLLDRHDYDAWLELFTDDVEYRMPLTEYVQGDVPPAGHPVIKDDKARLMFRVAKDGSGYSHVETPKSLTCHVVANVIVEEILESGELRAYSSFLVRQARKLRGEAWWAGRRTDILRQVGSEWRIARRDIELDSAILPRGISVFF